MLKHHFSGQQEQQAWQTRALFGSSYGPVILANCALCLRFISAGNAVTPQQPTCLSTSRSQLLKAYKKSFSSVMELSRTLESSPSPTSFNQKMAQCNRCMNLAILAAHQRALPKKKEWRAAKRRAKLPDIFQGVCGGSQVINFALQITLLSSWGCLLLLQMCLSQCGTHLFPLPHVFVCMHG